MSTFNRRSFLRATSGLTLGLPLLESLFPSSARAQATTGPRRFVAIQTYSGQVATHWYPTATPAGYRLRNAVFPNNAAKRDGTTYLPTRLGSTRHSVARLADFSSPTGISAALGPTLNRFLDKMNLIRGLDFMQGAGHNSGAYFGNYAAATNSTVNVLSAMPTIDRVLAFSPAFYRSAPVLRALDVGTGMPSGFGYTNYGIATGPVEQINFALDPRQAFNRAFSSFMAPPTPRGNPNASLMNGIHGDYVRLRGHQRLSANDKQLLERHMSFLDDLERKISVAPPVTCAVPTAPRSIPNGYPWEQVSSISDFQETVRLLAEVSVAALRCDVTRVVTFDVQKALALSQGQQRPSFHNSASVAGDWHQFAHDLEGSATAKASFLSITQWAGREVFGRFLELLDVEESGGKTFLDNSLVLWGNELGYNHYNTDVMTLMAGSAGGALRTGNYLDYIDWDQSYANPLTGWGVLIPGLPHNRLLVTVLQAMGLRPADYERGGRAGYGHHQYIDTPYNWPRSYDLTQIGQPLPGLMA
ncbi:MAG: DUF1552 domain-containing protein [Myxococcales bacterium]|nr:DUF1552 domain-containing protein [Myxococcales bacterium]